MLSHAARTALPLALVTLTMGCERSAPTAAIAAEEMKIVEASCGQCRLGLQGGGCDLAVRIDGKAYFVDGTTIDDHGDAHAVDGFCLAIRQARVTGQVVDDRFAASSFELLPVDGE